METRTCLCCISLLCRVAFLCVRFAENVKLGKWPFTKKGFNIFMKVCSNIGSSYSPQPRAHANILMRA
jgi:hypothetical protein